MNQFVSCKYINDGIGRLVARSIDQFINQSLTVARGVVVEVSRKSAEEREDEEIEE